jgi:hypothetical protein
MLLPNHFGEFLRTIFAGENLVAHVEEIVRLYVMWKA